MKQRLKLASVSPRLLDTYAEDGMTLDQLVAFTMSGDHERQEGEMPPIFVTGPDGEA